MGGENRCGFGKGLLSKPRDSLHSVGPSVLRALRPLLRTVRSESMKAAIKALNRDLNRAFKALIGIRPYLFARNRHVDWLPSQRTLGHAAQPPSATFSTYTGPQHPDMITAIYTCLRMYLHLRCRRCRKIHTRTCTCAASMFADKY